MEAEENKHVNVVSLLSKMGRQLQHNPRQPGCRLMMLLFTDNSRLSSGTGVWLD